MARARRWLALLAALAVVCVAALSAGIGAAPASAQETTMTPGGTTTPTGGTTTPDGGSGEPDEGSGGEGGGYETGACEISSEDFRVMFIRPTEDDLSFMDCPPDAYYLTYVDTRGFVGKISDMISQPAQNTYEAAQKTALNSMASTVFVWHAKVVATTTNVMGWAFGVDLIQSFRDPVEALTRALGDSVYKVLIEVVWGAAIGYGAYLSIVRDQVSNGVAAIIKSAVIGTFGLLVIREPIYVVDQYQRVVNAATGWVFGLVGEITADTKPGDVNPDGTTNDRDEVNPWGGPEEGRPRSPKEAQQGEMSALAQMIWRNYVQVPWAALQLNSGDPYKVVDGDLDNELLDIKYPQDRRAWLCGQAECPAFVGAPMEGGGTGGGTTGGTTGGGETTGSGETTGGEGT